MDDVFRALADPTRRALLDRLAIDDGLALHELCEEADHLTRFGVMKHLDVLEAAHLITVQRVGRAKLHYLNPVPIRQLHDRWISKFIEPWVSALVDLQSSLEQEGEQSWPHPVTSSRPTSTPAPSESGTRSSTRSKRRSTSLAAD
jgi:DNA-binding transcriptional ArsR family regulator